MSLMGNLLRRGLGLTASIAGLVFLLLIAVSGSAFFGGAFSAGAFCSGCSGGAGFVAVAFTGVVVFWLELLSGSLAALVFGAGALSVEVFLAGAADFFAVFFCTLFVGAVFEVDGFCRFIERSAS